MDGYSLTDKLRKARRKSRLTAVDQALYYELVALCNESGWEDVFECSNLELCLSLNVSENTVSLARINLINAGLISYKSGKGRRSLGRYSFESDMFEKPVVKEVKKKVSEKVSNSEAFPDTFSDVIIKTPPNKKVRTELDLSFVNTVYLGLVNDWLQYRKLIKKPLKTEAGVKRFSERLIELSGDNITKAKELIEYAKGKEWQDIYSIKVETKGKPGQILQPATEERKNKLLEKFA
jgi:predicted transcriptional regulator